MSGNQFLAVGPDRTCGDDYVNIDIKLGEDNGFEWGGRMQVGVKHLSDGRGRVVASLRLSVTDRCNLACRYCTPQRGLRLIRTDELLTDDELARLARVFLSLGVVKIRLTGGEPLIRPGFLDLVSRLRGLGAADLRLTTNGHRLAGLAAGLFAAGVRRVNVSLDSLRPARYRAITRGGNIDRVRAGIEAALAVGFDPVKVNVVVMRGFNDDEIEDFGRLALDAPVTVRFIEFMPLDGNGWRAERFVPGEEMMARLSRLGRLSAVPRQAGDGPARRFRLAGAAGEIGLITPLSNHFCSSCDRLRLTADGRLLNCLFSRDEFDLKGPLRAGAPEAEIRELIKAAAAAKPAGRRAAAAGSGRLRPMVAVGG